MYLKANITMFDYAGDALANATNYNNKLIVYEIIKYIELSFGLFGCLGNITSLAVLTCNKVRRNVDSQENVVYYGLLAITISDLLFCSTILPKVGIKPSQTVYKSCTNFEALYNLYGSSLLGTFTMWSVWFIVVTSAMRYIGICHPLKARYLISKKKIVTVLIVVTVSCSILNSPSFFIFSMNDYCEIDVGYFFPGSLKGKIFIYVKFIFCTVVPFIMLIFFNTRLLIALRKSEKFRKKSSPYSSNCTTATRKKLLLKHSRILENLSKKYFKTAALNNNDPSILFSKNEPPPVNIMSSDADENENDPTQKNVKFVKNEMNGVITSDLEVGTSENANPVCFGITELDVITTVNQLSTTATTTATSSTNSAAADNNILKVDLAEVRKKLKTEEGARCCFKRLNWLPTCSCNLSKPINRNSSNRLTVILITMTCFYILFIFPCEILDLDYSQIFKLNVAENFSFNENSDFSDYTDNSTMNADEFVNPEKEFSFDHYSLTPHAIADLLYVIIFSSNFFFYSILNVHFRQTLKVILGECVPYFKTKNQQVLHRFDKKSCWNAKKLDASENSEHFSSLHATERTNVQIMNEIVNSDIELTLICENVILGFF
ncbi:hypothetical protein HELRODRAFT_180242 [Helobdella robusta]|uniref:G-protein coupled receptors family 1 profile domain-containing protein n=1 Tax=Helobdella robusta TaxID=6412 RepID=T1FFM0_HELRO|nr:hypothetical protein HELRODRAFT_180242 [Helobdella robusta]ESN94074.1 hypothetical protein HELRODRAFT_180242 [Helobdella robusta]